MNYYKSILTSVVLGLLSYTFVNGSGDHSGAGLSDDDKRILGSFGFLSGLEPKITDKEYDLMRDNLHLFRTDPKQAIAVIEPNVTEESSAALDLVVGNLYFQLEDNKKAIESYEEAIHKFPDFRRAYKNLALLYIKEGNLHEAEHHLSKTLELGDNDGRVYGLLGYCYLSEDSYLQAEQAYRQAILREAEISDWKTGLVRSLIGLEKHAEANSILNDLLRERPENHELWVLQANGFLALDDPLSAAKNFEILRSLGKADTETLFLLGNIYVNERMVDLAFSAYEEAVEKNSDNILAVLQSVKVLLTLGETSKAKSLLSKVTDDIPLTKEESNELLGLKAKVFKSEGDFDSAEMIYKELLEADPLNGNVLIELAKIYRSKKSYAKAVFWLERAEKVDEVEAKAFLEHGLILVQQKKYAKAIQKFEKSLSIEPNDAVEKYVRKVKSVL